MKFLVFIITDKAKTSRGGGKRCRCYERRRAKELEEIESSHTLGGYKRCRGYSAVRYTICGCRCNERLQVKTDGSTCLTYTGFRGELEHLKTETRLIDESFGCVMGECVT